MGLNTVETYVFWNVHEPARQFDFSGQNDIAEFIREAQQEGSSCFAARPLCPAPSGISAAIPRGCCAIPGMEVRTSNPAFIAAASRWLHRLGQELAPLQSANGGPIIAVQVENEYGSFGSDHDYMEQIHQMLLDSGFDKAMLYTADGADELPNGSLPELPAVINFGSGSAKAEFAKLAKLRPNARACAANIGTDGLTTGAKSITPRTPKPKQKNCEWMLEQGLTPSIIYMFHGGTSFGWMNGANIDGGKYDPDVTSYDYDVPVSESGEMRPKYFLFRNVIAKAPESRHPLRPQRSCRNAIDSTPFRESASIWLTSSANRFANRFSPWKTLARVTVTFSIARIRAAQSSDLHIDELHSYAQSIWTGSLWGLSIGA
jgi:beta-galactosidase